MWCSRGGVKGWPSSPVRRSGNFYKAAGALVCMLGLQLGCYLRAIIYSLAGNTRFGTLNIYNFQNPHSKIQGRTLLHGQEGGIGLISVCFLVFKNLRPRRNEHTQANELAPLAAVAVPQSVDGSSLTPQVGEGCPGPLHARHLSSHLHTAGALVRDSAGQRGVRQSLIPPVVVCKLCGRGGKKLQTS